MQKKSNEKLFRRVHNLLKVAEVELKIQQNERLPALLTLTPTSPTRTPEEDPGMKGVTP